ncbi:MULTISPECIES: AAA family ATPase [unclassified Bradyrhizobium]|uniref:AAA family ATPase n=1 Tax=unclassified Bradyrhizobium TaxID=2631580 RepID=UPI0029163427|nr:MULTISPECIES: AAA family ATPase [unclassified Bradyrhizobium]
MSTMKDKQAAQINGAVDGRVKEFLATKGGRLRELRKKKFPPQKWIVPDLLTEGVTVLGGKPKVGKSWLALDVALAVQAGGEVLGKKVEQGSVLFLALEDTDRRIQARVDKVLGTFKGEWPDLAYYTEWPKLAEDGVEAIRHWLRDADNPRLVVVDVLEQVRKHEDGRSKKTQYSADYEVLAPLRALAGEFRVSILVVHHLRKASADDPMDQLSGTLGLNGAVDAAILLLSGDSGPYLFGKGREVEMFTIGLEFDAKRCRWKNLGPRDADNDKRSDARRQVLAVLEKRKKPMTVGAIAEAIGRERESIRMLIYRMHKEQEIRRVGSGTYEVVSNQLSILDDDGREII